MRPTRTAAVSPSALAEIEDEVRDLCRVAGGSLPFHGWHHVSFVRDKGVYFAERNGSDAALVAAAALVHDLNYLVRPNSPASAGRDLRLGILGRAGVPDGVAEEVDGIVDEAEMRTRHRGISLPAQALSDADTLFKALPVTPVLLAHRYLAENGVSIADLAAKIVGEQRDKHDGGYYFYSRDAAAQYSHWAAANLRLWQCVVESLEDPSVTELLALVDALPAA